LPGSEPPESNENANSNELAASLQADFRVLITTLAQQIALQDDPDSTVLATLWNAKVAAEQGLRLSERLAKAIHGDEKPR
jgi:hypothetical protein